ncbi:epidermal growth factor-like protein 7 isoform X4 [Heterocephalus glaber]|uniref:Epidermal growth factor-like protein 7 n=1 Tax=Heterocephalus glaber TaxID=10181 RepID=A0AAX6TAD7_HETGA|nr:epidermal growth factor-like protein 7 isoform X4 [Heterocephalus glaber]
MPRPGNLRSPVGHGTVLSPLCQVWPGFLPAPGLTQTRAPQGERLCSSPCCVPGRRDSGDTQDLPRYPEAGRLAHRGLSVVSGAPLPSHPVSQAPLSRPCPCRTIYRTAYRRGPGPGPTRPRYACCPGWKRTGGLPGACAAAICQPPCGNGGSCVRPGRCHCPAGWQGNTCHTDVDECSSGGVGCPQGCVNTAGSYQCQCREGHSASADGTHCLPTAGPPRVALNPVTGVDPAARAEVQRLQARVEVLEQKLQLVLDPLHGLASQAPEQGPQAPGSLLAHSLQQLDRIDSLSEQISFLEEQLGSCSCKQL